MHYNVRVIEYPNGDIQARGYSTLMHKEEEKSEEEKEMLQQIREERRRERKNPFDDSLCMEVVDFDDYEDIKLCNQYRSANRTKQAVFTYARSNVWKWFVTFTFSGTMVDRYNYDECSKAVRKWLNNCRRLAPDLQYLIVPEQHKDGAWHFHGLLNNTGKMVFKDSGKKSKGQVIYNMTAYKYGFTTATEVNDTSRVSKYIGKYITKSLSDKTAGKHRYFVSNNLQKPVSYLYFCESQNVADILAFMEKITNKKVAHVSQTKATDDTYTKVMYVELT